MSAHLFDQLSKQLARARSRREALGVLAATFGSFWFGACSTGPMAPSPTAANTPSLTPVESGAEEPLADPADPEEDSRPSAPSARRVAGDRISEARTNCKRGETDCKKFCCKNRNYPECCSRDKSCCYKNYPNCCYENDVCCGKKFPYYCWWTDYCYKNWWDADDDCDGDYETCRKG